MNKILILFFQKLPKFYLDFSFDSDENEARARIAAKFLVPKPLPLELGRDGGLFELDREDPSESMVPLSTF